MQLVVQYLTLAAIKLPSAGDNARSSVQHQRLFIASSLLHELARTPLREVYESWNNRCIRNVT